MVVIDGEAIVLTSLGLSTDCTDAILGLKEGRKFLHRHIITPFKVTAKPYFWFLTVVSLSSGAELFLISGVIESAQSTNFVWMALLPPPNFLDVAFLTI